jgi:hypothetical protein
MNFERRKMAKSTVQSLAEIFGLPLADEAKKAPAPTRSRKRLSKTEQRRLWGDVGHSARRRQQGRGSRLFGHSRRGPGAWRLIWLRMAPRRWYGNKDLCSLLPEYASLSGGIRVALRRGVIERGLNPDWKGHFRCGPRWLYRRVETGKL